MAISFQKNMVLSINPTSVRKPYQPNINSSPVMLLLQSLYYRGKKECLRVPASFQDQPDYPG